VGAERCGVLLREQLLHGNVGELRICVVRVEVRVGELLRLDHEVPVVRAGRPEVGEVDTVRGRADLEDVEHLERREVLAGGRQLVDVIPVVAHGDGLDPLGLELGQVGPRHHTASCAHLGNDRVRDVALVGGIQSLLLDEPQRAREVGVTNEAVKGRRVTIDRNVRFESGSRSSLGRTSSRSRCRRSACPHPSSAIRAARSKVSRKVRLPKRSSNAA
jgi:hypothetical protein